MILARNVTPDRGHAERRGLKTLERLVFSQYIALWTPKTSSYLAKLVVSAEFNSSLFAFRFFVLSITE